MEIKFNRNQLIARIKSKVTAAVKKSAIELETTIKNRLNLGASSISSGGVGSPAGSSPFNKTGTLMRSITHIDKTTNPLQPTYRVGTNLIYAHIQEYGGRITAKKGKFLAIPVGVDGQRAARDCKGDIRSLNLTFLKAKSGKMMLVKWLAKGMKAAKGSKAATGGQYVILFVLKKSVILPPRPYMRPSYAAMKPKIDANIREALAEAIAGGV